MKKFLQKSISIALCLTAVSVSACGEAVGGALPPYDNNSYTGYILAENGSSDYSIVIGNDADEYETFAADELQNLFKEATGATLPIVLADSVAFSEKAKVISIGDNSFQEASGVIPNYDELQHSGGLIVSKGSAVILTGAFGAGSLYAVYDFLNVLFDYEYYEEFAYTIKNVNKAELPALDIKNIPDFDQLIFNDRSHYDNLGGSIYNAWRQRIYFEDNDEITSGHSANEIMPINTYYAEHSDWYSASPSDSGWQLCYSNEEMLLQYIENVKAFVRQKPNGIRVGMGERDVNTWCQCSNCLALMRSYDLYDSDGTLLMAAPNSITGIIFKSRVAHAIDAWLEEEYPGRHLVYASHAYFQQRTPPVYKNPKTGEYILLTNGKADDPLKNVNKNIQWQVAAIEANRNQSWEDNNSQGEELKRWSVVTPNVCVYEYPQDARNSLMPYDGLHVHADNLRFAKSLGHNFYRHQGLYNTQASGFYDMRKYVISKLAWDVSLDPNKLADDYLRATCGPAYEYMNELYTVIRTRIAQMREQTGHGAHVLQDTCKTSNWPRELLLVMQTWIDKAYEAIEYRKFEDPERYEAFFRRIKIEELWIQYTNLMLYRNYYSFDEKNALIDEFELYSKRYSATLYNETDPMDNYIAQWRKS